MLFQAPEFSAHIWISGFTSKPVDFDAVLNEIHKKHPEVSAQFVDLDKIPGSRYLFLATLNALQSHNSSRPISRTLGMEILLYVSANKQINEAIRHVGMTADTARIAAILVGKTKEETLVVADLLNQILQQKGDDELIDQWSSGRIENVLSLFDIAPRELKAILRESEQREQAVERLAIERSALLTVRK